MATSTVQVEFICQFGARQFTHNHSIARSLVIEGNRAGRDAEYKERFAQAMMPVMKEHESACRSGSGAFSSGSLFNFLMKSIMDISLPAFVWLSRGLRGFEGPLGKGAGGDMIHWSSGC
ncbi:hypothetical protein FALCPG4_015601 [Fusarium falciforme]